MSSELGLHRQPLNWGRIDSEFDELTKNFGGPRDIGETERLDVLAGSCSSFPFRTVWKVLASYAPDEATARQHWPWVALAASRYKISRSYGTGDEPTPSKIKALLTKIERESMALCTHLEELKRVSYRPVDLRVPHRSTQLQWVLNVLLQTMLFGEGRRKNILYRPEDQLKTLLLFEGQLDKLARLNWAAIFVKGRVDPELLTKGVRGQMSEARGLLPLVSLAKKIWPSLTGRKASINKVDGGGAPDFVRFVQAIALLGAKHEPTYSQVRTAFRTPKGI